MPEAPPPGGWQRPAQDAGDDADALARLLARLAELVPPEVWERLGAAFHELLMALRALIDWYLERQAPPPAPVPVRDIPIL